MTRSAIDPPNMANILFIGLPLYDYTTRIIDSFQRKGHTITYFANEKRHFTDQVFRAIAPAQYARVRTRYHNEIVAEAKKQRFDQVIFIQAHRLSHEHMAELRKDHVGARFALYNWDSLSTHDYSGHLKYFDTAMTFDRKDAEKLGIGYLPLFAIPEYFGAQQDKTKKYDLYFVATIGHPSRINAVAALHKYCQANGIRLKLFLKCSPRVYALILARGIFIKGMTMGSLTQRQVIEILEESRAVFDHPNHPQSGYTMRFIENMCAGKKIVTTNHHVENEAFYSDDRFLAINDLDFSGVPAFLERPLTSTPSFSSFALDNWTDALLTR